MPPPAQKGGDAASAYLHPFACFSCRRSFKRASRTEAVLPCPQCGGPSVGLTRKFKPPRQGNTRLWQKVKALVRHGFLFWSVGEPYPETPAEVDAFAARHAAVLAQEKSRNPQAFEQIERAMAHSGKPV